MFGIKQLKVCQWRTFTSQTFLVTKARPKLFYFRQSSVKINFESKKFDLLAGASMYLTLRPDLCDLSVQNCHARISIKFEL